MKLITSIFTRMENYSTKKRVIERVMVVLLAMMMVGLGCVSSELHKVGDKGWIPNYNYTLWLTQQQEHFYVGDWLLFVFDKHYFNVLEVNKTNYESCSDQEFITNITRGGRDVFNLTEARPYYFLSSGGYCWSGMKIGINVENPPAPAPAPTKNNASPPPSRMNLGQLTLLLSIVFWSSFGVVHLI